MRRPSLPCALAALAVLAACGDEKDSDGGECLYDETPIVATVTAVEPATGGQCTSLCPPAVNVRVDIADADGAPLTTDYELASGVSEAWVAAQGWTAGATIDGFQNDITRGSCNPEFYTFDGTDEFGVQRAASEACIAALQSADGPELDACPSIDCHDVIELTGARCAFDDTCTYDEFVVGPRTWTCADGRFTEQ